MSMENSPGGISPEFLRMVENSIKYPDLPIAHVLITGDEEGRTSIDLNWMNGRIEDMLRIAGKKAIYAQTSPVFRGADREVTLFISSKEEAVRLIAMLHKASFEASKLLGNRFDLPVQSLLDQEPINMRVGFRCESNKVGEIVSTFKPETKYTIFPMSLKSAIVVSV